jgi:hypothetical protein
MCCIIFVKILQQFFIMNNQKICQCISFFTSPPSLSHSLIISQNDVAETLNRKFANNNIESLNRGTQKLCCYQLCCERKTLENQRVRDLFFFSNSHSVSLHSRCCSLLCQRYFYCIVHNLAFRTDNVASIQFP